jgi:dUTP pyrophosphatase
VTEHVLNIYWERLTDDAQQPTQVHELDAGHDLYVSQAKLVEPGVVTNVHTDIAVALPSGWYGHIIGRSSTPKRYGLVVVEAIIDAGYRGELHFQVLNPGAEVVFVEKGWRLAQLIILQVPRVRWISSSSLPESHRGKRGFGSSGR